MDKIDKKTKDDTGHRQPRPTKKFKVEYGTTNVGITGSITVEAEDAVGAMIQARYAIPPFTRVASPPTEIEEQ